MVISPKKGLFRRMTGKMDLGVLSIEEPLK